MTHLRTRAKSVRGEGDDPALAVSKCLDDGDFLTEKSSLRAAWRENGASSSFVVLLLFHAL